MGFDAAAHRGVYSPAMLDGPSSAHPMLPPGSVQDAGNELATEIGLAVLAELRQATAEGRAPDHVAAVMRVLGDHPPADAALELRPGQAPARPPAAPAPRRAPGTRTIRQMIRGAREIAVAPPGSELARYRIALLVLMLCLATIAAVFVLGIV
jgi:hypothetical protein